jgi:Beta/Gamma crystallin
MRPASFLLSLLALAVLAVSLPRDAVAQGRPGRDQVCVYEHADYGGWEQCFGVGEALRDLGNLRNQISSVRILGRAEITLFQHPDFQGRQLTLDNSATNLPRGWNDEADSLRVDSAEFGDRRRGERREDRVCVYQHVGFAGNSRCFDSGDEVDDLRQIGWNDGISSIRVFGGTRVAVFEDAGFEGQRLIVDRDIADLTQISAGGRNNWNDRISSLRVGDDRFHRGRR